MADISLPDDVFENMRHAQETAASMETTVKDFNDKVNKKFKEADTNEKNKLKQDNVKQILSAKEKTRYANIGAVFFEGAKDSIIGIFKQIEKNKSKGLFRKAYDAVADKVNAIKESVEEHKTGLKILGVIALLGGVYYMFKDWFDEKLPKVWDSIKDGVGVMTDAIKALPNVVSGIFDGTGIKSDVSNFFNSALTEISNFLDTLISFFKDIFSDSINEEQILNPTVERDSKGNIINKDKIVELDVRYRGDDMLFGNYYNKVDKATFGIPQHVIKESQEKLKNLIEKATPEELAVYKAYLRGESTEGILR